MKEIWRCQWETIPGNGEQVKVFPSLATAKQAMRQKIAESIDLKEYIADLDTRAAQFLENYLSDPQFPRSNTDVPEAYEEPEHGELMLDSGFIVWDYPYDAYPHLDTNLVMQEENVDAYRFEFRYNYPEEYNGNGVRELSIRMELVTDYGKSAYPLLVLSALREYPQTQDQIIKQISEIWQIATERKAIGRHLQLLQDLGLPVQHNAEGYFYNGIPGDPKPGIKFTPNAYPLMVWQVLDSTPKNHSALLGEIQEQYGTKMGRQTLARHLALLKAMGYKISNDGNGYYLG